MTPRKSFLAGFAVALALIAAMAVGAFMTLTGARRHSPDESTSALIAPLNTYGPQKVVYHVSTKGDWRDREAEAWRLVGVINNHLNAVKPENLNLQVVFQGDGVDALRRAKDNPELAKAFDSLKSRGVQLHVCANTLTARQIALAALYNVSENDLVPAAVAEFVRLQQEGYGYIKF